MFAWTTRAATPAPIAEPSPLLTFIAGEFAPAIAGSWPAPHADFLTAPAARRHLLCLGLAVAPQRSLPTGDAILRVPLKRAIKLVLPCAPDGLARCLERLGETAWKAGDYLALIDGLAHPHASKTLRHADEIGPETVHALASLPDALLRAGIGLLGLGPEQARLLGEVMSAIRARDGDDAVAAAALRWSQAPTPESLFDLARDDLIPEIPAPALPADPRLLRLSTKAAMREAAVRYRNCLRGEVGDAVAGSSIYYEWTAAPGAIVEVIKDRVFGWRLHEARLADNAAVPEPVRGKIVGALRDIGVHVGRAGWDLDRDLARAARLDFKLTPEANLVSEQFGDDID